MMIDYATAQSLVSTLPLALRVESLPLLTAGGRILARPIEAPWPLPRFDNSAMDGFAVRCADIAAASPQCPVSLPLAGESAAGVPMTAPLSAGTVARISTGAPLPAGADGIVPIENAAVESTTVSFTAPALPGCFIRRRGEDVPQGSLLAAVGARLDPPLLAFLAMYNFPTLDVFARPRVGILTSGDEIKPHGAPLRANDVVGVNIYYLEQELRAFGCEPRIFGISPDDPAAFQAMLAEALEASDMVVTTAGVSVGEHDVVGQAVRNLGGEVIFWRVSIRPGKPSLVAVFDGKPFFGLPGNPVAVCCNTEVLVKPFLREKLGIDPVNPALEEAVLLAPCPRDPSRLFFVYARPEVRDGRLYAQPLGNQSSGNLFNPARGGLLLVAEPGADPVPAGASLPALRLRSGR
ncbi:MAG: molybdopterin molybdotransferase [Candidatus Sumerlaeota bacterium]|nr:molybdopterin molybdotransferase [Candidatus Sumerlaeota bacterium]